MKRRTALYVMLAAALVMLSIAAWYLVPRASIVSDTEMAPSSEETRGSVATPDQDVRTSIAGTWRSDDDVNFIRVFEADGTVTDSYVGSESATTIGAWSFVVDASKEQAELPASLDVKVIKIQFPEEVLYFALIDLTDTHLALSYLGRGNTLSFTRVP